MRAMLLGPLLAALLWPVAVDAARCRHGRFVVSEGGLLVGSGTRGTHAVVLAGRRLDLEDLCGATKVVVSGTPQHTRIVARWKTCPGLGGKVRLRGVVDGCNRLDAMLTVRQPSVRVPLVAVRTRCGDGVLDGGADEACDDGNLLAGDGCDEDCRVERCGDGIPQGVEACDDGNTADGDGCSAACRREQCGDGIVQPGEECDDANGDPVDGCNFCSLPHCGNGVREPGEQCDGFDLGGNHCSAFGAQGGVLGCHADCTFAPETCVSCGDGRHQDFEVCDGDDLAGETCESRGYPEGGVLACGPGCISFDAVGCFVCGNGQMEGPEECDGNDFGGATCDGPGETGGDLSCDFACRIGRGGCWRCGNGRIDPGEHCDTGARLGDPELGCSTTCTALCGDGVVAIVEQCDDGNTGDGDGCSGRCGLETIYDGGGDDPEENCLAHWGASGTLASGTVECRDGEACDATPDPTGCTFRYFVCFNDAISLGPPGLPCTRPAIARVALGDESLTGPTALGPADQDGFLDMVEHVLGRRGSVTRDETGVSATPAILGLALCGGATLDVPAGSERALATVTTSGGTPPTTDADRLVFHCLER